MIPTPAQRSNAQRPVVLLVNPNRMAPPIGPVGLDYVAAGLVRYGYEPVLCDLTFEDDWQAALDCAVEETSPVAVGVSVRNIDDAYFASQDFVLETSGAMVRYVRSITGGPVVLGGVGFSVAPAEILEYTGGTHGVAGEGEEAFPCLLDALAKGADPANVPGAVFHGDGDMIVTVPPVPCDLQYLPTAPRRFADNQRYFSEGGQAGVETKRGCNGSCIYCVEPNAKGASIRLRPPESVADEFAGLLDQGIHAIHLCDSEFNRPVDHARAVAEALVRRGIGPKLRWYTYAAPKPFDVDLARLMMRAGCAGINFGVDHVDDAMLRRLGRTYGAEDIRHTTRACRDAGLAVMLDMLLGAPGENRDTIAKAIEFLRDLGPDCVGLSCGVRLYPHTPLARMVRAQGPLDTNPNLHGAVTDNDALLRPIFYVDAAIGEPIHAYVTSLIDGDRRFFHADPAQVDANYNYNNNSVLAKAIRSGARGAYWDILRRL